MEWRTRVSVTVIVVGVYAALGAPQIRSCLANGGDYFPCFITGLFLGALKLGFYLLMAILSGLFHIFHG
jgi:hypothetical protein